MSKEDLVAIGVDDDGEKLKAVTPQDLERLAPLVFQNDEHLIVIVE